MVHNPEGEMRIAAVIPAHNVEKHIQRALSSVSAQTYAPSEVIVVDDASTDATSDRARSLGDSRIRVIHRDLPGPGGYAARNEGVERAHAEWIAFLDADDEWLSTHLETIRHLHEQFPHAELLATGWRVAGATLQARQNHYTARYGHEGDHALDLDRFLSRWSRGAAPAWTSAVSVRRETLLRVGGFPAGRCTRGGDVDTWLRVMLSGATEAYSPRVSVIYHRDVDSSVTQRQVPQVRHCTGSTIHDALGIEARGRTRLLLKRLANAHRKDPLRKKARRSGLSLKDFEGFYAVASPGFFMLLLILLLIPQPLLRGLLTVRDRLVRIGGQS
jgi:glycosyltransferase involved in cell wall biosynthesis